MNQLRKVSSFAEEKPHYKLRQCINCPDKGTSAAAAFVQVPPEELKKAKTVPDHRIDYNSYPPSILGELMLRTIQSDVSSWPHPSVPLQLFECVSRYHEFFNLVPHTITTLLPAFLDERSAIGLNLHKHY